MWIGSLDPPAATPELPSPQVATLTCIIADGACTRPELGAKTGLSAPTILHAVQALEQQGFVRVVESRQGARGRAAQVFALHDRAGWSLGIDVGTSHVELVALDLAQRTIASHRLTSGVASQSPATQLTDDDRAELRRFSHTVSQRHGKLRAAGVAIATIVPPGERFFTTKGHKADPSIGQTHIQPSFDLAHLVVSLDLPSRLHIVLENNINCSAISESYRSDNMSTDLLYMHLGVGGVGLGIVSGGKLLRGHNGAAGEMRWFPYPYTRIVDTLQVSFDLESSLGASRLASRSPLNHENYLPKISDLFSRAEALDADARNILNSYASDVSRVLLAFISVLDPQAVILGGSIGNNPILLPLVQNELRSLGRPVSVSGDLGERSSALGAAILATQQAYRTLGVDPYLRAGSGTNA